MAKFIAQVVLERDGALPEDSVVNVWHFESDTPTGGGADFDTHAPGLSARLQAFYTTLGGIFANTLSGNATVKLYDFDDDSPRIPKREDDFNIGAGGTPLPAELAICLSMEAAKVGGVNMARRRGRVYLGPLSTEVLQQDTSFPDVRVHSSYRQQIVTAADTMATGTSGAARLAVFSPTTLRENPGDSGAAWHDVARVWVDNAFDIQRRRGAKPSLRTEAAIG